MRSDSFSLDLETRYKSRLAATVELAISKSNAHRAVFIMALCACGDGLVVALCTHDGSDIEKSAVIASPSGRTENN